MHPDDERLEVQVPVEGDRLHKFAEVLAQREMLDHVLLDDPAFEVGLSEARVLEIERQARWIELDKLLLGGRGGLRHRIPRR
ncbi:MAG: hypothetical protein JO257_05950 [Deltaproteobacteria bacterium]|nr:hypothetical protein [Deltaproteobacteria bacterium]